MIRSEMSRTNWWGLASIAGLFIWFLYWFKNEPQGVNQQVLYWGPLVLVHGLAIRAAKRRYGWIYLLPYGIFWILVIIALAGGTPH